MIPWGLRRRLWNLIAILKFRANRPVVIPVPAGNDRPISDVSFVSQFPSIPIHNVRVADRVPADEASRLKYYFYEFQVALYRLLSPMQPGLPDMAENPDQALVEAYTPAHRRCYPAPVLPPEYLGEVDLGFLAVAGPYAGYLVRTPDGDYQWDLRQLARYEHHDGLCSLGLRVLFRVNEPTSKLEAVRIDCELGSCRPTDPTWGPAKQLALCAVTNHVSLVRHFNWVHLAVGGPFAIATRNCLDTRHPLRRLLWPHMFGTQYSNQIATKGQMAKGGDFDTVFSFTHTGMCELFEDSYEAYDITVLDPERDAERRGLSCAGFDTPSLSNQRAIFDVLHAHAARYLALYYSSDQDLRTDAAVVNWLTSLDRLIPNGIRVLRGDEITIAGTARLIAALSYLATCPFTGWAVVSRRCDGREPGVAGEGGVDGVDGADAVVAGADQVGAAAAVVGKCGQCVPVAGDGLMSFGALEGLFAGVVRPGHGEVSGEGPDLVGFVVESFGQVVSGVVALGPVAVAVGGDSPPDCVVVASAQISE